MTTIYRARLPFGTFRFSADLTEASAPIRNINDDDDEAGDVYSPTGYQTADARHDRRRALALAIRACGREYFSEAGDERSDDEIIGELIEDVEITTEETAEDAANT